jgi:hypothetical protein
VEAAALAMLRDNRVAFLARIKAKRPRKRCEKCYRERPKFHARPMHSGVDATTLHERATLRLDVVNIVGFSGGTS